MKRFASLLTFVPGQDPESAQQQAHANFPNEVRQSKLSLRLPNAALPQSEPCVILGIATYSAPELDLLDDLDASLGSFHGAAPTIHVFDVLDCSSAADFKQFIPGLDTVFETPVLGLAVNGQVIKKVMGLAAVKDELRNLHLIDSLSPVASSSGH